MCRGLPGKRQVACMLDRTSRIWEQVNQRHSYYVDRSTENLELTLDRLPYSHFHRDTYTIVTCWGDLSTYHTGEIEGARGRKSFLSHSSNRGIRLVLVSFHISRDCPVLAKLVQELPPPLHRHGGTPRPKRP